MLALALSAQPDGSRGSSPRLVPRPADYHQRVASQFDRRAAAYDVGNRYHPPLAARLVREATLQPGEAVLDVGAGTGFVALLAAEAVGADGHVIGVDLSTAMLQQAERKTAVAGLCNVEFLAVDIDACSFSAASFDAILCSSALPFLPDIPASLARWRTWLRPGGRVAFNVPQGVGSRAFSVFAALAAERGLLLEDPSAQFANEQHVRQLLSSCGYTRCNLDASPEANVRPGQSPQQWAAAGWDFCLGMPFADLKPLLAAGDLEEMRSQYLQAATLLAQGFQTAEGILEPYSMLWVVAHR